MQTTNLEDAKEFYRQKIKFESVNPPLLGGQSCGIQADTQRLTCEELDLVLECGFSRGALKNRELLMIMFEAFIDAQFK